MGVLVAHRAKPRCEDGAKRIALEQLVGLLDLPLAIFAGTRPCNVSRSPSYLTRSAVRSIFWRASPMSSSSALSSMRIRREGLLLGEQHRRPGPPAAPPPSACARALDEPAARRAPGARRARRARCGAPRAAGADRAGRAPARRADAALAQQAALSPPSRRLPQSSVSASRSARTGTAISAAAVGVGARRSEAKSISVVSVSWPTAEISGMRAGGGGAHHDLLVEGHQVLERCRRRARRSARRAAAPARPAAAR